MCQVQAEVEASGARAEGTESESDEDDAEGGRDERGSEKIIAMIMEDHDGGSDDDDPGGDGGAEQSASTPRSPTGSGGRESGASRSSYVQKYYWTHSGESLAPPWPLELSKTPRRRLTERFPCSNDLARVSLCPFC